MRPLCILLLFLLPAVSARAEPALECLIEPSELVRLSTPVEGLVASVAVDRGDMVKRGQVVARMESRVEEVAVALARVRAADASDVALRRAERAFADRERERTEMLKTRGHVAQARADRAQTDAELAALSLAGAKAEQRVAKLELERAEAVLEQRMLRSPVDGVIVERLMAPGEYRGEQSHVFTIAQLDPLHVEAFLPVAMHGSVRVGDRMIVRPEPPVGGAYPAVVKVIDRVFDAASGTFGVRLALENRGLALPAGLKCTLAAPGA